MQIADANYLNLEKAYQLSAAPSIGSGDYPPQGIDANFWALEVMGMLSYYHILSNREATVTPGSDEDNWLKAQMQNCVSFLKQAQSNEAAYEAANPGKTFLPSTFYDILTQAVVGNPSKGVAPEIGSDGFDKWWIDNLESLDGSGETIIDWFSMAMGGEQPIDWKAGSASDMMGLAFSSTMLLVNLDTSDLGQMGSVDAYFSPYDWAHPFQPAKFPTLSPEMLEFYLWNQCGSPQPDSSGWTQFTAQLGYLGNLLDPKNIVPKSMPPPTNYNDTFWTSFQTDEGDFDNGLFPNGDTLDSAFENYFAAFSSRFIS
jgi:hypothetical protein